MSELEAEIYTSLPETITFWWHAPQIWSSIGRNITKSSFEIIILLGLWIRYLLLLHLSDEYELIFHGD